LLFCNFVCLLLDRVDIVEEVVHTVDCSFHSDILGLVVMQFLLNAHAVESMSAREHIELSVKNWLEAKVAHLAWVDGDVFVLLLTLLLP